MRNPRLYGSNEPCGSQPVGSLTQFERDEIRSDLMNTRYKETSEGGLAVSVVLC
jgi:hypothetical protein